MEQREKIYPMSALEGVMQKIQGFNAVIGEADRTTGSGLHMLRTVLQHPVRYQITGRNEQRDASQVRRGASRRDPGRRLDFEAAGSSHDLTGAARSCEGLATTAAAGLERPFRLPERMISPPHPTRQ